MPRTASHGGDMARRRTGNATTKLERGVAKVTPDRHGKTQQRRSEGLACRRAALHRRSSGLPTARAVALELEATRNPRRCRLTISHYGLGRMLTSKPASNRPADIFGKVAAGLGRPH